MIIDFYRIWWLLKEPLFWFETRTGSLLAAGVFGHSLGSFTNCVFGQFTGQKQPNGGLDLAGADGRLLVVVGKAGSFGGDALEDVVNKGVHDAHGFAGDTSVRMNLLQHLVYVDSIAFLSLSPSLLLSVDCRLFTGLLLAFLSNWSFWCHLLKLATANERSFKIHAIYTVHMIMSGSKSSLFDWITALPLFSRDKA